MKFTNNQHIYLLSSLLLSIAISCSNNEEPINDIYLNIPDIAFETILIEQGIDTDGIINQKILKSDAEKVIRLDLNLSINFGEIHDLTGIEGFVNIKLLSAASQKIEQIDLSSNTLLDTLYLQGNKIAHLDISNNPNLIMVDLTSNALTSLTGIAEAIQLKHLRLSFNDLEEFNIDNPSVESLLMSHNLLTSINTTGAIHLKHILLRLNKLTTLDLSSNTLLETLVLSGNKIENINLDKNSELTHLYISSNLLANLDISKLHELLEVKLDRNPDLTCIKVQNDQYIPSVSISDDQELNTDCN